MESIDTCVAHYANQWESLDKPLFEGLQPSQPTTDRLATLKSLCGKYKIARSLRREHDEGRGLPRYAPLLDLIDEARATHPAPSDAPAVVTWFRDKLAQQYGGVRALSLSSKVLWFVYRSPMVIFDELARKALDTPGGNYHAYWEAWSSRFKEHQGEIAAACAGVSNETWFHERVFDIYLWRTGNAMRSVQG